MNSNRNKIVVLCENLYTILNTFLNSTDIFFRTLSRTSARSNPRHFKQIIFEHTIIEQIIDFNRQATYAVLVSIYFLLFIRRSDDTYMIGVHLFLNYPTHAFASDGRKGAVLSDWNRCDPISLGVYRACVTRVLIRTNTRTTSQKRLHATINNNKRRNTHARARAYHI